MELIQLRFTAEECRSLYIAVTGCALDFTKRVAEGQDQFSSDMTKWMNLEHKIYTQMNEQNHA
jgi:hypothetical protein